MAHRGTGRSYIALTVRVWPGEAHVTARFVPDGEFDRSALVEVLRASYEEGDVSWRPLLRRLLRLAADSPALE